MPRYKVTLVESASYEVIVDAANEDEAAEKAEDMLAVSSQAYEPITCDYDVESVELVK